jgi:hypothetical protein
MKKTWESPKLIVLVRSRPQEGILQTCKSDAAGGSPQVDLTACVTWYYCFPPCESFGDS